MKIAVIGSRIKENLADFPLLLNLQGAPAAALFASIGSSWQRLKLTDASNNNLWMELVFWDSTTKTAWLWAKVNLPAGVNTVLTLVDSGVTNDRIGVVGSSAGAQVWSAGFVGVWHLEEANAPFIDSTGRGHNGSKVGTFNPASDIGQLFSGAGQVEIPSHPDFHVLTTGELTCSMWLTSSNIYQGYKRFFGKDAGYGAHEYQFLTYSHLDGNPQDHAVRDCWISCYVHNPWQSLGAGDWGYYPTDGGHWVANRWSYVCGTFWCIGDRSGANGSENIYLGPASNVSGGGDPWINYGAYVNTAAPVTIGGCMGDLWQGQMAEIRISNVVRRPAWIEAEYYAFQDQLLTYTDDGVIPPPPTQASLWPLVLMGMVAAITRLRR